MYPITLLARAAQFPRTLRNPKYVGKIASNLTVFSILMAPALLRFRTNLVLDTGTIYY
jgi:hypothetical protein